MQYIDWPADERPMKWRPQTREEYLKEKNPAAHTCLCRNTDSVFWINDTWALVVDLFKGWALIRGIGYCPWCGVALPVPESEVCDDTIEE